MNQIQSGVRYCLLAMLSVSIMGAATDSAQSSTQKTINDAFPKIVKIFGAGGFNKLAGYGTGFFISPNGHIATIWSHVLDTSDITVILNDGRKFRAELLGADTVMGVAVLKIEAENLPYFKLEEAATKGVGTRVLGFSNMFKVATGDEPVSVIHGVIAAKTKLTARRGAFEIPYKGDVFIVDGITNNPGAAGGVLLSQRGKLLGMIGKELRDSRSNIWINYAMPLTDLSDTLDEIVTGVFKPSKPETLEDRYSDGPRNYTPRDFGFLTVPDVIFKTPAYVDTIHPDSLAAKAGLKPDDLVLFVNDDLVQSCKELNEFLGALEEGSQLRLTVRRGKKLEQFEFTVPPQSKPKPGS